MCGLAGSLDTRASTADADLRAVVQRMGDSLRHRGPDDAGVWTDAAAGIALASRRLAVVDISAAGHQPMVSPTGRYVIAFNGEIYNFQSIRRELGDIPFRGHSDTEVVLASFERWGVAESLARFDGMFAFAAWDRSERALYLARDRFGEKPLYYGRMRTTLLFGSELKALRAHPDFEAELDRDALALYLRHNYIPAPYSIYKKARKLPPAHYLRICGNTEQVTPYWSLRTVVEQAVANPFRGSEEEAVERLDALLRDAVRSRLVADVPLGAFLSGGIDSSTVVALMQQYSSGPVRTFTVGLREAAYDEAASAHRVAQHLHTEHTELYVTPREAMDVIPLLPGIYDEPFADSSQIPTYLVSRLARQQVTVALSGDGGDEVFGGYNRYAWTERLWRHVGWLPRPLRRMLASAITAVSPQSWNTAFDTLSLALPGAGKQRLPGFKLHKIAGVLDARDVEDVYLRFTSHWTTPAALVLDSAEPPTLISDPAQWARLSDITQQMMVLDTLTYLPDDILTKVDRASMAVSLEARVPLLDPALVEFAWSLPLDMKVRGSQTKRILRRVLARYLPRELFERPKWGFGIPLDGWLRGPLRDWVESLLDEHRLRQEGFFDPRPIRKKWAEHLSGFHGEFHLWDILMFQAWLRESRGIGTRTPVAAGRTP